MYVCDFEADISITHFYKNLQFMTMKSYCRYKTKILKISPAIGCFSSYLPICKKTVFQLAITCSKLTIETLEMPLALFWYLYC